MYYSKTIRQVYPSLDPEETKSTRRLGRCSIDAQGPFGWGQFRGLLSKPQARGVGIAGQDGAALEH
jgi:hypothetical protein